MWTVNAKNAVYRSCSGVVCGGARVEADGVPPGVPVVREDECRSGMRHGLDRWLASERDFGPAPRLVLVLRPTVFRQTPMIVLHRRGR